MQRGGCVKRRNFLKVSGGTALMPAAPVKACSSSPAVWYRLAATGSVAHSTIWTIDSGRSARRSRNRFRVPR
jgi:hypothetical protein